jgi:hypothetical protein
MRTLFSLSRGTVLYMVTVSEGKILHLKIGLLTILLNDLTECTVQVA